MKKSLLTVYILIGSGLSVSNVFAKQNERLYTKPVIGVTQLSDQNFVVQGSETFDGNANVSTSTGIVAG